MYMAGWQLLSKIEVTVNGWLVAADCGSKESLINGVTPSLQRQI
jgi:hypothetical protein